MKKTNKIKNIFADKSEITVHAFSLGKRLHVKDFLKYPILHNKPLMIDVGGGVAVIFRYGVVILFGLDEAQEKIFLDEAMDSVTTPYDGIEVEAINVKLGKEKGDNVSFDTITLADWDVDQLLVIADIMGKSQILSYYEYQVTGMFDKVEPISLRMKNKSALGRRRTRNLISYVSETLETQRNMAGQVEILDKPDFLWEKSPALHGFFVRLEDEFEIRERHGALKEKLDLIYKTSDMMLDMVNTKHSLRVEWYITILIVIDITIHIAETYVFKVH